MLLQSALGPLACAAVADGHMDRQEYQAASIKLQNILQKTPNDRDARQRLGLLSLEWGNGPLAEKELRRAIELGVPQETVQFPLAEALLMQGKYQEILDYLAPMALMSAQDQAKLLAYRGDAWLGLNQSEKARAEYETALGMAADTPLAKLGLARLALADNRAEEAQKLAAEVLALAPGEPKAWSFQGALHETSKQLEEAEQSYSKAIGLKRFSPVDLASRAIVRINANKLKDAQEDVDILKKDAPGFFLTEYAAGMLDIRLGKHAEAQAALEKALKLNDKVAAVKYYLGIAHVYQNHDREAEKYLASFMKDQPQAVEPRLFLGLVKFREKDREAARSLLLPVLERQPDNEFALKLMSDIEFAEGNHDKGFQYLDRIPKARKPAGKAGGDTSLDAVKGEDKGKVLAALDAAKELDDKLARQLTAVALGLVAAKDFGQADTLIGKISKKAPDSPLADNLLGLLSLARNDPEKAKEAFESALEKSPGNPAITHGLAQLAVREKKTEAARKLYEKALRTHPKDLPTRLHLAELDGLEGKPKAMEERLASAIKDHPTALQPRLMLASHFLSVGDPGHAQSLLEDIQPGYPDNMALLILLIHAQLDSHEPEKAMTAAKALVQHEPASPMGHYLLARAYAELKDTANLRKELDKALAANAKFLPARYALVKLLATEKKMPEARAALEALAKQYPDSAETLALQGWLATEQNQSAEAVAAYGAAFAKFPGAKMATDLAQAEWKAGNKEAALKTLEGWIRLHPDDTPPRLLAAEFYVAQDKTTAAIQHLEAILKTHPENALVMNNLAWLYRGTAPAKALEMAQSAASIAPKAPNVLDTLAMIELDQGQVGKAVKLLKRAVELAPQHKPTQYHLAMAMGKANQRADATRILQELLADPRPFPGQQDAKALLDTLSAR
ncbi:MAG: PEP-CTERM system TPR-repeat protein PrsT [Elusimicrobiales bacterium]|nr:PEP-CTERM system TPR-repeat protein PrsT [Elusimicrobiales bacterium]